MPAVGAVDVAGAGLCGEADGTGGCVVATSAVVPGASVRGSGPSVDVTGSDEVGRGAGLRLGSADVASPVGPANGATDEAGSTLDSCGDAETVWSGGDSDDGVAVEATSVDAGDAVSGEKEESEVGWAVVVGSMAVCALVVS